jgi:predicted MFS family arabinose efflux permease
MAVIVALVLMRLPQPDLTPPETRPLERLGVGLQYILGETSILGLVALVAAFSMVGFGALTLVPVFAKDILQIGVEGFGQLLSWQGVGALAGGGLLVFLGDHIHKGKFLTLSRLIVGPAILGLSVSRIPWVSMGFMAIIGYSLITQLVITNTLIQTIVPDDLRGRVMSTYTWALGGFYPLGSLLMGALGDQIGAPSAALISGCGCLLLVLFSLTVFPDLHRIN